MLNRYTLLLQKGSYLLYTKSQIFPIVLVPEPSIYSSIFLKQIEKGSINVREIFIPIEADFQSTEKKNVSGLKLYLTSQGNLEESTEIDDDKFLLAKLSKSIINDQIEGAQTKGQYFFQLTCKFILLVTCIQIYKVLKIDTRIENMYLDPQRKLNLNDLSQNQKN